MSNRDLVSGAPLFDAFHVERLTVDDSLQPRHFRLNANLRLIEGYCVNRIRESDNPRIEGRAFLLLVVVAAFVLRDAEQSVGAEVETLRRSGRARSFG